MTEIIVLDTPGLGDRGYLVGHDGVAFAVDPQRDIDRVLAAAHERGWTITDVFETHLHNDYVSGGLALARATGAAYRVNAGDDVGFERAGIRPDDEVKVGDLRVRALATPGHTFTHLAYALDAPDRAAPAAFTGGSLLLGSTGRPDLLGPEHTRELARAQHASARLLAAALPDDAELFPTHGFGSFCAATQTDRRSSTIGAERHDNPALTLDEEAYVADLLAGLGAYPAYYARLGPINAAGPAPADLSAPRRADAAAIDASLRAGEWVVDLRTRRAFAAGHVPGALNFGLDGSLATYLGWLIPWGTPVTLLATTADDIAAAQRELTRIGIDGPSAATGSPAEWTTGAPSASFPRATFADLANARREGPVAVLDVRRPEEWSTSHIRDALNIPLHDLQPHIPDLPPEELWVHCTTGYRASIATSLLTAAAHPAVLIDDDYTTAETLSLTE
ncbi:MBL fold metallo-hydrolase [Actinomadura atramentaria]|uniref:MBL fold metallo-hydrolase n=1 Tax=Actinomadura atramentaria TaxID=1990 RepID=UPI00036471FD|nr:MBL fold metallo-hydrolase [Actinomadura atramentaria]